MHRECFEEAHAAATDHINTATTKTVCVAVQSASSEVVPAGQVALVAAGPATAAVVRAAVATATDLVAVTAQTGIQFSRTTQMAAGMAQNAGSASSAMSCGAASAIVVALEIGFSYHQLVNFQISPQEFGIRCAGSVAGGTGAAVGAWKGLALGAAFGSGFTPLGTIVCGIVGGLLGSLVVGGAARYITEATARYCCGEDECRTVLLVGDSLERLGLVSFDPTLVSQTDVDSAYRRSALSKHPDRVTKNNNESSDAFELRQRIATKEFTIASHDHLLVSRFIEQRSTPGWEHPMRFLQDMMKEKQEKLLGVST